MIPINNSDTAWLIVSDFNQDNDLPYKDLRDDILNCNVNEWACELNYDLNVNYNIDGNIGNRVGDEDTPEVGSDEYDFIIGSQDLNGASSEVGVIGERVGGNRHGSD
jgi:hypothetical protein